MDFYPTSSSLQHIVGYGSNSVVLAHHPYTPEIHYYVPAAPVRNTTVTRSYQVIPQVSSSTQTNNPVVRKSQIHSKNVFFVTRII